MPARARDAVLQDLGDPRGAKAHDARGRAGPGAAGRPSRPVACPAEHRLAGCCWKRSSAGVRPAGGRRRGAAGPGRPGRRAPSRHGRAGATREDRASGAEHERRSEGTEHRAPHRGDPPDSGTLRATGRKVSAHQRFWRCPRLGRREACERPAASGVTGPQDERPRGPLPSPPQSPSRYTPARFAGTVCARTGPACDGSDPEGPASPSSESRCLEERPMHRPPRLPRRRPAAADVHRVRRSASSRPVLCLPVVLLAGGPLNGWIVGVALWSANWALQIFTGKIAINSSPTAAVGLSGISFISRAWLTAIILFVIALQYDKTVGLDRRRGVPGGLHLRPRSGRTTLFVDEPERPQGRAPVSPPGGSGPWPARCGLDAHARAARPGGGGRGRSSTPRSSSRPTPTSRSSSGPLDLSINKAVIYLLLASGHLHRGRHLRHPGRPEDAARRGAQNVVELVYEFAEQQIARPTLPGEGLLPILPVHRDAVHVPRGEQPDQLHPAAGVRTRAGPSRSGSPT